MIVISPPQPRGAAAALGKDLQRDKHGKDAASTGWLSARTPAAAMKKTPANTSIKR